MTERSTSTHEKDTFTDDNSSWEFVNNASDSASADHFNGRWLMIGFFGIFLGAIIYLWCRTIYGLKGKKDEKDNYIEMTEIFRGDSLALRRNTLV